MKLIIDELNEGERIDSFLSGLLPEYSRSKIQEQIKKGACIVNNKIIKPSYTLRDGDILEFNKLKLEKSFLIEPENIPLEIIYNIK